MIQKKVGRNFTALGATSPDEVNTTSPEHTAVGGRHEKSRNAGQGPEDACDEEGDDLVGELDRSGRHRVAALEVLEHETAVEDAEHDEERGGEEGHQVRSAHHNNTVQTFSSSSFGIKLPISLGRSACQINSTRLLFSRLYKKQ
ncbi:MAG: hypothetical protein AAFO91_16280 [Bacteroidota bacterium]